MLKMSRILKLVALLAVFLGMFIGCEEDSVAPNPFYGIKAKIRLSDGHGGYDPDINIAADALMNCKNGLRDFTLTAKDDNNQQWKIEFDAGFDRDPIGEYKTSEDLNSSITFTDENNKVYETVDDDVKTQTTINVTEYVAGEKIVGNFHGYIKRDGTVYELINGYFYITKFEE
jgi:hypothetical protein